MTARRSRRSAAPRPARPPPAKRAAALADDASTRERILLAALEVFAEQGFDGARTRDIADRAAANLGLIKYYFDTKEKLWQAAVTRAFGELQSEIAEAAAAEPGGDERAQIERLLREFVAFVARRPAFMRLMNDEGKRDGARMRWLADRHVAPIVAALRALVERAQSRGLLPHVAAESMHYIALGAAGLVFSQAPECLYLTGVDPTDESFAAAHADAVVRLLLGP
jgi:AcrR family transcriptional regulator